MLITESDIYNYVFNGELIPAEKIFYIESNKLFNDEIALYRDIKQGISTARIIILTPSVIPSRKKRDGQPRYAAASADLVRKTEFTTFTDQSFRYVGRLLKSEEKNLLYIISADESTEKKIRVTTFPSETTYVLDNIKLPIELHEQGNIELIHLEELK